MAPFHLHRNLIAKIDGLGKAAEKGRSCRIVVKMNSLTDDALIASLMRAGKSGVKIDLIVRGACMLPPGLPGVSDNLVVRSVVGRFLEHSRVCYFRWGESDAEEALYLSSADWMSRNMFRRIEVAWPVLDPKLRQRVIDEALTPYLYDSLDAWQLGPDGHSVRIDEGGLSAQQALMRKFG
jgi:polyphosphate kinase